MLLTVCSVFRISCVIINHHFNTLCGQTWCGFVNYDDNLVWTCRVKFRLCVCVCVCVCVFLQVVETDHCFVSRILTTIYCVVTWRAYILAVKHALSFLGSSRKFQSFIVWMMTMSECTWMLIQKMLNLYSLKSLTWSHTDSWVDVWNSWVPDWKHMMWSKWRFMIKLIVLHRPYGTQQGKAYFMFVY